MSSDKRIIIAFRNYFRNKMVNLSARSIKHFLPDAEIHCFTLYKHSPTEYDNQEPLLPYIKEYKFKTKYVGSNPIQDHIDPRKTSGFANSDNAKFFSEGYNLIQEKFKHRDSKVLILAEDHFFTTGVVLKELIENDWLLAYAPAFSMGGRANASILGINPNKLAHLFPMKERSTQNVETEITDQLLRQVKNKSNIYEIKNRKWIDYCGDGLYTNSSEVMEEELKRIGII